MSSAIVRRSREPSARSTSTATSLAPEARSSRQRRSCQLRTGAPSTATTRSPSRTPAAAAGVLASGSASSGRCAGNAGHEGARKQQHGEQEVGERPGGDDRYPLPDALLVERAREIGGGDGALALVDHLHVAAERHRRDGPLGAVGAESARPHDAAEAHREPQHLHAAPAGDPVMAELVEDDEHAQHDEEREQLGHGVHQAASPA